MSVRGMVPVLAWIVKSAVIRAAVWLVAEADAVMRASVMSASKSVPSKSSVSVASVALSRVTEATVRPAGVFSRVNRAGVRALAQVAPVSVSATLAPSRSASPKDAPSS